MNIDELFSKAISLRDKGEYNLAKNIFLKIIGIEKHEPSYYLILGQIEKNLGLLNSAEQYFRKAVELLPDHELASRALFHALWNQDKTEDALDEIRRFQSISDSEHYREIMAEINEKWGDHHFPGL